MTDDPSFDPANDPRSLDDLIPKLRGVQLYMIRMDMQHPVDSPLEHLGPHLREHILWLENQEQIGVLFLSGANRAGDIWDGSGTAIVRADSLEHAQQIAETEPFHREGLRVNSTHGWLLNEGGLRMTLRLFDDSFELS